MQLRDVVVEIGGKPTPDVPQLLARIAELPPGSSAQVQGRGATASRSTSTSPSASGRKSTRSSVARLQSRYDARHAISVGFVAPGTRDEAREQQPELVEQPQRDGEQAAARSRRAA